jgi:CDP-glucose 4,6-dehydratase
MSWDLKRFASRRVLVTGDTGFKGSWLALWLSELGAEVTGVALAPEQDRGHFRLLGLDKHIRHIDCDIRDGAALGRIFAEAQPEIVFHLAAQALVRRSYADPKTTFDTNVGGSVNVLEAVRATPSIQACVYITSDKCYRNKEWIFGYRENDELGGHDPYSASKAAAELVYETYRASYFAARDGFGIGAARAGNVIGGGDWAADRIIPDCIRFLSDERPIVIRSPRATRPWQHVLDPLHGYMRLALSLLDDPKRASGPFNFGPDVAGICTVAELVEKVIGGWGSGKLVIEEDPNAPKEATLLHLNTDKAQIMLDWRPRWGVDESIARTVQWYKEVVAGGSDAGLVSRRQIKEFMAP